MTVNQEEELVNEQMADQPDFLTILFTFFSDPCVATFQLKFSVLKYSPFLSLFCDGPAVLLKLLKIFATCINGKTK